MREVFLDSNAHMPLSKGSIKALLELNGTCAGHGHASSPSVPGKHAAKALESARHKIASLLGAESSKNIVFTSTCTSACEWAARIMFAAKEGNVVHMSPAEHPAVKDAFKDLFQVVDLPYDSSGVVTNSEAEKAVCIHIQNEIGIIEPLENIKSSMLFSDMTQSAGKVPINLSEMPVQLAVFGAHKWGGPVGVGVLYLKETSLWRQFGTGSRYGHDRPGTPDVVSVVAAAAGLEEAVQTMPERIGKMIEFRDTLEPGLKDLGLEIIGENASRCPNTTFVKFPKPQSLMILENLGKLGIYVGLGSACGSMYVGNSPIMSKLGNPCSLYNLMRFSQWGEYGAEDARYVLSIMKKLLG